MEKIKISIITICYNNKSGLEQTIRSVGSQIYNSKEFIIIDGGSRDGSTDLIDNYQEFIDIFVSEPDNGIYDAINKGISKATGEWIICMNAGDSFTDKYVLENIFKENIPASISVIYSDYWAKTYDGFKYICYMDRSKGTLMHQSCIYRKKLHAQYGLYLVTKPYICSDLQFLLMIPNEEYFKAPFPISINACGGVSQNNTWCDECSQGLKVAFRIESMNHAFFNYHKAVIKNAIPYKIKRLIKQIILRREFIKIES